MFLPEALQTRLEVILQKYDTSKVKQGSSELTAHYREGQGLASFAERLAYLSVRLPATFASIVRVFQEFPSSFSPRTLLDLGSGPGTVLWAALQSWEHLEKVTLYEADPEFVRLGNLLLEENQFSYFEWKNADLRNIETFPSHDLVVFSYSYGEFASEEVLKKAWDSTKEAIVLIEPGTPRGYQTLLKARSLLIENGGFLLAPCPHMGSCPLNVTEEWCHFSTRVGRSTLHRLAKEATLSYEDEKFSYCIFTKKPISASFSRLLGDPQKRSGHSHLFLCTPQGLQKATVSKREKELYKLSRKAEWGSKLPFLE